MLERADEESELGAWLLTTREHFAGQVRSSILHSAEQHLSRGDTNKAADLIRQVHYLPSAKPLDHDELQKLYALASRTGSELTGLLREEAREFGAVLTGIGEQQEGVVPYKLIPRTTTSFIGRHSELQELRALLGQPEIRLLTIQGIGGVGKTRLALELAQTQGTEHLAFVQLSGVKQASHLALTIAQTMRLNLASGLPPIALITSAIGDDPFALYLDNYEQLLPDTQVIQDLLEACPSLRVVVTSRERLGMESETLFPIGGLDQSDGDHSDAVRLFLSRARQANARFHPTSEARSQIMEICQRLDGSPLAIELAAGWVRRMPVQQIAEELSTGLELLEAAGDDAGKHKSLRAIFEQSWAKLIPSEQHLLVALSVFKGGFTRLAATLVTGATLRPLLALLDAAFLNVSPEGRYTQHPLLAHFVEEKAHEFPERLATVRAEFVRYYRDTAWETWQHYYGENELKHIEWGRDEYENVAAAIAIAIDTGDILSALKLCVFQAYGWQSRGLLRQGAEQIEALLDQARQVHLETDPAYRWGLQVSCLMRLYSGGWNEDVAARLTEAQRLAQTAGDFACSAQCLIVSAVLMGVSGRFAEARELLLEALKYVRGTKAHYEEGHVYVMLVTTFNNMEGEGENAEHYLQRGLEHVEKYGLGYTKGRLLLLKSERLIGTGQPREAWEILDELEGVFTALHSVRELALVYRLRGLAAFFHHSPGQPTESLDLAAADWEVSGRMSAWNVVNKSMDLLIPQLGDILLAKGQLDAAEEFFQKGLVDAHQQGVKPLVINCSLGLGRTLFAQGRYEEALKHLKTTLELTQMLAVWCIAAEAAAAALARLGAEEMAVKIWGKAQQERGDTKAMRFPVYAEYYSPEHERVLEHMSDQQFQSLLETGSQLDKSVVIELLNECLNSPTETLSKDF